MERIFCLVLLIFVSFYNEAEAIMCHRCNSAMGGCGDEVDWRMFPWRDCGDSEFCIKKTKKDSMTGEITIIRECENTFLKSTRERLAMPVLRRHGYCSPARQNDPKNPLSVENTKIQYCFCNDWNGCNSANGLFTKVGPITFVSMLVCVVISRFL